MITVQIILGEGRTAPAPIETTLTTLLPDATIDNYDDTELIRAAEVHADLQNGALSGHKVTPTGAGHIIIGPEFRLG